MPSINNGDNNESERLITLIEIAKKVESYKNTPTDTGGRIFKSTPINEVRVRTQEEQVRILNQEYGL